MGFDPNQLEVEWDWTIPFLVNVDSFILTASDDFTSESIVRASSDTDGIIPGLQLATEYDVELRYVDGATQVPITATTCFTGKFYPCCWPYLHVHGILTTKPNRIPKPNHKTCSLVSFKPVVGLTFM